MWQKEAAWEAVPFFANAHTDRPAFRYQVQGGVLGDAVKLRVKVQRSVVACKNTQHFVCFSTAMLLEEIMK